MSGLYRSLSVAAVVALTGSGLAAASALAGGAAGLATASVPHLLSCRGKGLIRPGGEVVISCGDGNFAIDDTRWSSWTASAAQGTTDLRINLCQPTCVASTMSTFRDSRVRLFDVKQTAKYGSVFTRVAVTYTHDGKPTTVTEYPLS